MKRYGEILDN